MDSNAFIVDHCEKQLQVVNDIIKRGTITIELPQTATATTTTTTTTTTTSTSTSTTTTPATTTTTVAIESICVLDHKAVHDNNALAGVGSGCPCGYCTISQSDIGSGDATVQKSGTIRTIKDIALLAHLELGVCPGCHLTIVEEVTDQKTQVQRAQVGDPSPKSIPKVMKEAFKRVHGKNPTTTSYTVLHFGVRHATRMILYIEPMKLYIDLMHMNNCCIKMLCERTVWIPLLNFITTRQKKQLKAGGDDSGTLSFVIFQYLKDVARVTCPKVPTPENTKTLVCGVWYKSLISISINGKDANAILDKEVEEHLHSLIHPAAERAEKTDGSPDTTDSQFVQATFDEYKKSKRLWRIYRKCWHMLNKEGLDRETKATRCEKLGMDFMKWWAKGKQTTHIYPHLMAAHLPAQIRQLGVDITRVQTQSMELGHQPIKRLGRSGCNGREPGPAEKIVVKGYNRMVYNKKTKKMQEEPVKSHTTTVGGMASRAVQLLEGAALRSHLDEMFNGKMDKFVEADALKRQEDARRQARTVKLERDHNAKAIANTPTSP